MACELLAASDNGLTSVPRARGTDWPLLGHVPTLSARDSAFDLLPIIRDSHHPAGIVNGSVMTAIMLVNCHGRGFYEGECTQGHLAALPTQLPHGSLGKTHRPCIPPISAQCRAPSAHNNNGSRCSEGLRSICSGLALCT